MEAQLTTNQQNLKDEVQSFILGGELSRKLSSTQKDLCIKTSLAFNLNPLKREVHFVPFNNDIKIVVGYEVYLKRAEKSGKLNGWRVDIDGAGSNMKAVVTINRKDWEKPFIHEVFLVEARQSTPLWLKMPRFMLKKVAIAQAFRLAFPEELGGLPYMPEEVGLEGATTPDKNKRINPAIVTAPLQEIRLEQTEKTDSLECEECGRDITLGIKSYSQRNYGRDLCMTCQKASHIPQASA
ncbi:MAG: recombinase RecT [bacterium]|nr:recombinase RecT [bacterium]